MLSDPCRMKFDYIGKKETLKVELRFSKVKLSNVVTKIAISSSFYIGCAEMCPHKFQFMHFTLVGSKIFFEQSGTRLLLL